VTIEREGLQFRADERFRQNPSERGFRRAQSVDDSLAPGFTAVQQTLSTSGS
jgi:hypothetical protein